MRRTLMRDRHLWLCAMLCLLFLSVGSSVHGAQADSSAVPEDREVGTKSPRGAVCRSALVPGWGQWYTGHRWKAALVAGTEVFLVGAAVYEHGQVSRSTILSEADRHRDRRTTFVLWFMGTLVYSLLDAYVDAHLYGLDEGLEIVMLGPGLEGPVTLRLCARF